MLVVSAGPTGVADPASNQTKTESGPPAGISCRGPDDPKEVAMHSMTHKKPVGPQLFATIEQGTPFGDDPDIEPVEVLYRLWAEDPSGPDAWRLLFAFWPYLDGRSIHSLLWAIEDAQSEWWDADVAAEGEWTARSDAARYDYYRALQDAAVLRFPVPAQAVA